MRAWGLDRDGLGPETRERVEPPEGPAPTVPASEAHVVAPHFKRRLSGVTTTMIQLVPEQARQMAERGLGIATLGPGLPASLPRLRPFGWLGLLRRPKGTPRRVWHARRNVEMLPGILLRDVLRAPLTLLFTSASQREHTAYTRWLIGRMDRVVATSERGRAYLRVPAEVVMHGIDLERFRPPESRATLRRELGLMPGRAYVGCFGRIRERKGTGDFVEAMIRILPERPDWTALVAGRATAEHAAYERTLREKAAEAGLAERILFVGEHADIHRWYAALDLFVAPQRWEGFGMSPLEAMASGVPVVATDVGAFSELLPDPEAGIVPPGDVAALADRTARLMDDEAARIEAGLIAREHVERDFAIEGEARRLCAIYAEMLGLAGGESSDASGPDGEGTAR